MELYQIITNLIGCLLVSQSFGERYNIAPNKNVKTSNSNSEHPVSLVTDNDVTTFVQVDYTFTGCWLQFDLLGIYMVSGFAIWPTNDEDYKMARVLVYMRLDDSIDYSYLDIKYSYSNPLAKSYFSTSIISQNARYVLFRKDLNFGPEMIKIAEIAIYTEIEEFFVPTDGLSNQSHVFDNKNQYRALYAVDNNPSTCIHTAQEDVAYRKQKGWWRIDLRRIYNVYAFQLNDYNAEESYHLNYTIKVGMIDDANPQLCGYFNSSKENGFKRFQCYTSINGRYVTIERNDTDRIDVVNFCEIQIIARHNVQSSSYILSYNIQSTSSSPQSIQPTTIYPGQEYVSIPLNKDKSSQSHDFYDWSNTLKPSKFALDNNGDTCSLTAQEDASLRSLTKAWWRLDLEKTYLVNSIKILPGSVSKYIDMASAWPFSVYVDKEYYAAVQLCADFNGYIQNYANYITLECRRELQGRYLTILGTTDTLALCEVAVLAANVTLEKNQGLTFCTRDEIIIGCVVGFCCLILGAMLGWIITYKKMKKNSSQTSRTPHMENETTRTAKSKTPKPPKIPKVPTAKKPKIKSEDEMIPEVIYNESETVPTTNDYSNEYEMINLSKNPFRR